MKIFRNKDSKLLLILYLVLCTGCILAGYRPAAAAVTAFARPALLIHAARYRRLENLASSLDKILHGDSSVNFGDYSEGELSVMKNQLEKVVLRLRDQSEKLKGEKVYLMDSLADISHQLRTPLTSINIIIDLLRRDNLSDEKKFRLLADLSALTGRIEWLINALLKISRIDAGRVVFRKDKILVKDLFEKAGAPLAVSMDLKNQRLVSDMKGDEYFYGDMPWMAEALGNVIKNCSEHTPENGTITLKAEQTAVYTRITVTDTGPGFTREDIQNVFSRFYKGKNSSAQSVGIGMAMARAIIMGQNGIIKVSNRPGGGAMISIKMYHSVV